MLDVFLSYSLRREMVNNREEWKQDTRGTNGYYFIVTLAMAPINMDGGCAIAACHPHKTSTPFSFATCRISTPLLRFAAALRRFVLLE